MGSQVVSRAKQKKATRIQQAKDEASEEIEKYRREIEEELCQMMKRNKIQRDEQSSEIEKVLNGKLRLMQEEYNENEGKVVKMLLDSVCAVESRIHPNYTRTTQNNQRRKSKTNAQLKQSNIM